MVDLQPTDKPIKTSRWRKKDEDNKDAAEYLLTAVVYAVIMAGLIWWFGDTMVVAILSTLFGLGIIYVVFKAIKVLTGTGSGAAASMTFLLGLSLTLIQPAINLLPSVLPSGDVPAPSPDSGMQASHFNGAKASNTTPSELDDLMAGWE